MGGSTGGIIVRNAVKAALSDPTVHGQLPAESIAGIDAVLAKDPGTWEYRDILIVSRMIAWALENLA
jgi:hypothetical protein